MRWRCATYCALEFIGGNNIIGRRRGWIQRVINVQWLTNRLVVKCHLRESTNTRCAGEGRRRSSFQVPRDMTVLWQLFQAGEDDALSYCRGVWYRRSTCYSPCSHVHRIILHRLSSSHWSSVLISSQFSLATRACLDLFFWLGMHQNATTLSCLNPARFHWR